MNYSKRTDSNEYKLKNCDISDMNLSKSRLRLSFENGYLKNNDHVKGSVIIEGVQDESYVLILKKGLISSRYETMSFHEFYKKYQKQKLHIDNEYYGDQEVIYIVSNDTLNKAQIHIVYHEAYLYDVVFTVKEDNVVLEKDRYLIKNTTRQERERIVYESLGLDIGCETGDFDTSMYDPYIEGYVELKDINKAYYKNK